MMNLDKLLRAKSFVIVGANDKPGFGLGSATNIAKGKNVRVYFLNPNRDSLLGQPCYHSLEELPEIPDCMALVVPARLVNQYLEAGGKMGIGAAIVFASGFAEEGTEEGRDMERRATEICERYQIALCGPNCIGFQNYVDEICGSDSDPCFAETPIIHGCGFVSQSGLITGSVTRTLKGRIAYAVSAGNGPICSAEDYLLYFTRDKRVNVLAAYIEGIRNAKTFELALQEAWRQKKPVVLLKSGRSRKGSKAAASHTGNMAGNHDVFLSVCRKFGVIMTETLAEFASTVKALAVLDGRYPQKPGIAGVNFSGGENTLFADLCEEHNLVLPELREETCAAMREIVPAYCTPANPLDATATMFRQEDKVEALFRCIASDPNIGTVILGSDLSAAEQIKEVISTRVLSRLSASGELPTTFILPSFEQTRSAGLTAELEAAGIPMLPAGALAYTVLQHIRKFAFSVTQTQPPTLAIPEHREQGGKTALSEYDAEQLLGRYGIPFPKQGVASSEAEVATLFQSLRKPVVMKILSPDILHKTEVGGVKLNICDERQAAEAYREILAAAGEKAPQARLDGVLMQEMLPKGNEVILGVKSDPQFGPTMLVGLGGVFTELFRDVVLRPCPVDRESALDMLRQLKAYPLFCGYRGAPELDTDALADIIVSLSRFAEEKKDDLIELDLNPVIVLPKGEGAVAADALVTLATDQG